MPQRDLIWDAERRIATILQELDEKLSESHDGLSDVEVDLRSWHTGLGRIQVDIITNKDASPHYSIYEAA